MTTSNSMGRTDSTSNLRREWCIVVKFYCTVFNGSHTHPMWPKMVGHFNVRGGCMLVQGVVGFVFVFVFYDSEEFIVQDIEYMYKFRIQDQRMRRRPKQKFFSIFLSAR